MASRCLTVAKLLLRSNQSLTAAASTIAGRHTFSSQSSRGKAVQVTLMGRMEHPFLSLGVGALCNINEYEREVIVMVDMPGIGKEGLEIKIKKNSIHIRGKAEREIEDKPDKDDIPERIYAGVFDLPPGFYDADEIKASIKFGVLKLVIPKLKPSRHLNLPHIELRGNPIVQSVLYEDGIGIQDIVDFLQK
ncbi:24.1 kDa heat shock protein, mitochondrial-like [Cornus florida]|uniref:24.1 kDa heat shock protein, mitochondrial-like n=1 Tax=Cornus florida TaxID=4283 RepID=UPI0028A1401B|nr:24.1 kDa heat shock protein, mitochondrial-like [Cornus florida]